MALSALILLLPVFAVSKPGPVWSFDLQRASPQSPLSFAVEISNEDPTKNDNDVSIPYNIVIGPKEQKSSDDPQLPVYLAKAKNYWFDGIYQVAEPYVSQRAKISFIPGRSNNFYIGRDSTFKAALNSSSHAVEVPTVPFAFNLAAYKPSSYAGAGDSVGYLGEIVFGGYFNDYKPVTYNAWWVLYETLDGRGTFLQTGSQVANFSVTQGDLTRNMSVTIDINSDTTTLGAGFKCGDESILFHPSDPGPLPSDIEYHLEHPYYMYGVEQYQGLWYRQGDFEESKLTCRENHSSDHHVLGKDFFQGVYTYVGEDGAMFMTGLNVEDDARPAPVKRWNNYQREFNVVNWSGRPNAAASLRGPRFSAFVAPASFALSSFAILFL